MQSQRRHAFHSVQPVRAQNDEPLGPKRPRNDGHEKVPGNAVDSLVQPATHRWHGIRFTEAVPYSTGAWRTQGSDRAGQVVSCRRPDEDSKECSRPCHQT